MPLTTVASASDLRLPFQTRMPDDLGIASRWSSAFPMMAITGPPFLKAKENATHHQFRMSIRETKEHDALRRHETNLQFNTEDQRFSFHDVVIF